MAKSAVIRRKLLKWFRVEGRVFSWRKSPTPFQVLITEVLLKKTTADAVERFIPEFWRRYPDARSLAAASLDELQGLLRTLGLSKQRASQLHMLADALVTRHQAMVPDNWDELLALPAVGPYTAGAVLCFAYNRPEPIVDTNVARVLVRVYGLIPSRYEARRSPEVWSMAREIIGKDATSARMVNWALLDLGALICKAHKPQHAECPLYDVCCLAQSIRKQR